MQTAKIVFHIKIGDTQGKRKRHDCETHFNLGNKHANAIVHYAYSLAEDAAGLADLRFLT